MAAPLSRRCVAEVIGTFILVFIGCGSIVCDTVTAIDGIPGRVGLVGIAIAFGLVVTAMIYAIGDVSGAHINPAVTVALLARKKFPLADAVCYIAAQMVGAIAAAMALRLLHPAVADLGVTNPMQPELWGQSIAMEVILTFILVYVILQVTAGSQSGGLMAGGVIGGIVATEVLVGGPISGASMNPARSIGPALISGDLQFLWIYLLSPIVGALLAVICFNATQPVPDSDES